MSAISDQPANRNFLDPTKFRFSIKRAPNIQFFVQSVNLPGFSIGPTQEGTPFVKIPFSGEHIDYEPLTIQFMVDEDLQNYMEIYTWIRGLGFPDNYDQYKALSTQPKYTGTGIKSDISLMVLTSSNNPKYNIVFSDAFPTTLSRIQFDANATDIQYTLCSASFSYTSFEILNV